MKVFISTSAVDPMKKIVKGARFSLFKRAILKGRNGADKTDSPVSIQCRITDVELAANGTPKRVTYSGRGIEETTITVNQFLKNLQNDEPESGSKSIAFSFTSTRAAAPAAKKIPESAAKTDANDTNVGKKVKLLLNKVEIDSGVVAKITNAGTSKLARGNVQEQKVFILTLKKLGTLKIPVNSSMAAPFPTSAGSLKINISSFATDYKVKGGGR